MTAIELFWEWEWESGERFSCMCVYDLIPNKLKTVKSSYNVLKRPLTCKTKRNQANASIFTNTERNDFFEYWILLWKFSPVVFESPPLLCSVPVRRQANFNPNPVEKYLQQPNNTLCWISSLYEKSFVCLYGIRWCLLRMPSDISSKNGAAQQYRTSVPLNQPLHICHSHRSIRQMKWKWKWNTTATTTMKKYHAENVNEKWVWDPNQKAKQNLC